jgi:hypothetical protein
MRGPTIALGLAAILGTSVAVAAGTPSLTLVHKSPLVVRGSGFRPHMTVRVVETAPVGRTVSVRTSAAGTFVADLVAGDPCSNVVVHAVGRLGGRASLRIPPGRLCAPAVSP